MLPLSQKTSYLLIFQLVKRSTLIIYIKYYLQSYIFDVGQFIFELKTSSKKWREYYSINDHRLTYYVATLSYDYCYNN
jgi:hypothetical protein